MDIDYLDSLVQKQKFVPAIEQSILHFIHSYYTEVTPHITGSNLTKLFATYVQLVKEQVVNPHNFSHFHTIEREPFDFFEFGLKFIENLIDWKSSFIKGTEHVAAIVNHLDANHNVILLANHQTEIDPQLISLMLMNEASHLPPLITYVAGHRVTSDPLAAPFARGINLLCIHSKRYIEHPPEEKAAKLHHNTKTLSQIENLLNKGGACIYVAPSGGRDRYDEYGNPVIAPFDAHSVEIFKLLAEKAKQPTHFHLLALSTMAIMPPPKNINIALGEERNVYYGAAKLSFSPSIPLQEISDQSNKKDQRNERSTWLSKKIAEMYNDLSVTCQA